jgi:hypothetical protein
MNAQTIELNAEDTLKFVGLQKTAQRLAVLDILTRAEIRRKMGDYVRSFYGRSNGHRQDGAVTARHFYRDRTR